MNADSQSPQAPANDGESATPTTPHPTIFDALHAVAHAQGARISLTDHRGRQFLANFYADDAPAVRRYGVWGYSASGASQLVVWKGKGRGPNGNRVRSGWGNPKNAQALADQMNEAAAAWRRQYGPVPKPKNKAKKRRK